MQQGDGAGGAVRLHSVTPGKEAAQKPHRATCHRLLLLQQGGRTHTGIESDHVHLLPVIDDHECVVKRT